MTKMFRKLHRLVRPGTGVAVTSAALLLSCLPLALAQSTPIGLWRQFDDRKGDLRSIIRIEQNGGELAGTIVKAVLRPDEPPNPICDRCPDEFKNKPIEGLRILWGLKGEGREWDGGRVLDPENGKIYRVKLRLSEDGQSLEVRGYIGFSLFGRSQVWKRAAPDDVGGGSARLTGVRQPASAGIPAAGGDATRPRTRTPA